MNMNARPRRVMIVSILLLLWNLIGIGAFFAQWQMVAGVMADLPPEQQAMWRAMPGWAWASYGIAVFAGAMGAIGLVMRKAWAVPLLALSLVAVLVQFFNAFVLQDGIATVDANAVFFPLFIIAVGILQLALSRRWKAAGWLG
jgi:hypothetical protein